MFHVVAHTQYGPIVLARFLDEDRARTYATPYRDNGQRVAVEYHPS